MNVIPRGVQKLSMTKPVFLLIVLLACSSCQKKKTAEQNLQQSDNYVPPAAESETDTTQSYLSPSDAFSDRSQFSDANFQTVQVKFRGTRNISYHVSQSDKAPLTIIAEYLHGAWSGGDTVSTATRILLYSENELIYRKAFPLDFGDAMNFSSVRKFDYTVLTVSPTKAIVYYWFNMLRNDGTAVKEYHAVSVDREGISNELSGDIVRIGNSYETVRFLNENRLKAKVSPNLRYPYLTIDMIFTIDWKSCTAAMDVPVDTIFTVSDQPVRYFNSKIKLYTSPDRNTPFREMNFRRLTQAKMQRTFIPSLFDAASLQRDRVFIEFTKSTAGWIDYETMLFEEIISEN
ncbi:MAG: hypothetical protein WCW40_01005 [Bacteroidota bacterium]